ncbi:MAG: ABC transporter ATP-binding protein [Rhodospirillales bacterium]|nr:ABC transporter ATP-binding protein [Rhodospirillales bacterium]MBO6788503.1 ABC transporter ATP-binding protein [Rhodospirillales bacterium]
MSQPDNSAEPEYAVEIEGLSKIYGGSNKQAPKHALKDVSLKIRRGSFFGLLGPNGAGKSTLINILAGLVNKTDGSAKIWGHDIDADMRAARRSIGVVPQELNIDPFFTPRELLDLQAGLYGVPEAERQTDEVLEAVGLSDKAEAYTRSLSGGMRRRLLVGKAMVHRPPVLVLDEPSAGVDVDLRRQLWTHVKRMNDEGITVLLTTHYLEEAEALCDEIAIINHGRIVACEPTVDMLGRLDARELQVTLAKPADGVPTELGAYNPVLSAPDCLTVSFAPSKTPARKVLADIEKAGLEVADFSTKESDLEDIFIRLTHDDADDAA